MSASILFQKEHKEELLDKSTYLKLQEVDGVVRIPTEEFEDIKFKDGLFGHFNLEQSSHRPGGKYLLVKLVRHGKIAIIHTEEELPLLSDEGAIRVVCVKAENNIPYEKLSDEYFRYSMDTIQNVSSLKKIIKERYAEVRNVSGEQINNLGVAYTLFKLI